MGKKKLSPKEMKRLEREKKKADKRGSEAWDKATRRNDLRSAPGVIGRALGKGVARGSGVASKKAAKGGRSVTAKTAKRLRTEQQQINPTTVRREGPFA